MARPHFNGFPARYELHRYVIDSLPGKGRFGITYLASDTNLHQKVAIKEFLPAELATRSGDSTVYPLTEDHTNCRSRNRNGDFLAYSRSWRCPLCGLDARWNQTVSSAFAVRLLYLGYVPVPRR